MTNKDWSGNANSIWKTLGASNHTDEEREADDYYATDPIAIDKLLSVEKPNTNIWECACGAGHLSERLKQHGYSVYSTDIVERGYCDKLIDFLANDSVPPPPRDIRHYHESAVQVRFGICQTGIGDFAAWV